MMDTSGKHKKITPGALLFAVAIISSALLILGRHLNVYRFAVTGAIFELLWLPLLAMNFLIPVISFFLWKKEKFSIRSLYLYACLIAVTALVYVIFFTGK